MLRCAVDVAHDTGIAGLTFAAVADAVGTSSRMIIYYFPSKNELVTEVMYAVAQDVSDILAPILTRTFADHRELASASWPLLTRPENDATFAVYFEAIGLAAAGTEPYTTDVREILEAWAAWLSESFEGDEESRRREALATMTLIDGLLVRKLLFGLDAAMAAAEQLDLRI